MILPTSILLLTKDSDTLGECMGCIERTTIFPFHLIILNGGEPLSDHHPYRMKHTIVDSKDTLVNRIKMGEDLALTEFLTVFNDDFFPTYGWLPTAYRDFYAAFPDGRGFLCLNEGLNLVGRKAQVMLTNKKSIKTLLDGVWYDTAYKRFRVEVDLALRAQRTGRYAYSQDAVVLHKHRGATNEYAEFFEHDRKVFNERWPNQGGRNEDEVKRVG